MFDVIKEILTSKKKEFTDTNYKGLQEALVYIKKQFNRY